VQPVCRHCGNCGQHHLQREQLRLDNPSQLTPAAGLHTQQGGFGADAFAPGLLLLWGVPLARILRCAPAVSCRCICAEVFRRSKSTEGIHQSGKCALYQTHLLLCTIRHCCCCCRR
jgi:hypothetical protein